MRLAVIPGRYRLICASYGLETPQTTDRMARRQNPDFLLQYVHWRGLLSCTFSFRDLLSSAGYRLQRLAA